MGQAALPSPYPKVRIFVYAEAFIFTGTVWPELTKMEGEEHINGNGRNSSVATVRGEIDDTREDNVFWSRNVFYEEGTSVQEHSVGFGCPAPASSTLQGQGRLFVFQVIAFHR